MQRLMLENLKHQQQKGHLQGLTIPATTDCPKPSSGGPGTESAFWAHMKKVDFEVPTDGTKDTRAAGRWQRGIAKDKNLKKSMINLSGKLQKQTSEGIT